MKKLMVYLITVRNIFNVYIFSQSTLPLDFCFEAFLWPLALASVNEKCHERCQTYSSYYMKMLFVVDKRALDT